MSFGKCHHGFEATSCGLCQQERIIDNMRIQQENERRHREAMRIQEKQYELAKERENRERYESEQRRMQSNSNFVSQNQTLINNQDTEHIKIESVDISVKLDNSLRISDLSCINVNNVKIQVNDKIYQRICTDVMEKNDKILSDLINEAYKFGMTCTLYREGYGGYLLVRMSQKVKETTFNYSFIFNQYQNKFHVDPDKLEKTTFYGHTLIDKAFKDGVRKQINSPNFEASIEKHIPEWFENLLDRHPLITLIIIISSLIWILNKIKSLFG